MNLTPSMYDTLSIVKSLIGAEAPFKKKWYLSKATLPKLDLHWWVGLHKFCLSSKKTTTRKQANEKKRNEKRNNEKKKLLSAIGHPIFSHLKTLSRCQWTKSSPKLLDSSSPPKKSKFEARKVRYGAQTFCWWWPWHQLFVGPNVVTALWVC